MSNGVQLDINVGSGNSNAAFSALIEGLSSITGKLNTLNQNFISSSQQSISAIRDIHPPLQRTSDGIGGCTGKIIAMTQAAQGISNLTQQLSAAVQPGIKLNSSMADLSAITGVTGGKLKEIEMAARASAKAFGTDAAQNAESYKLVLSQLSPDIAKNSTALKMMGDNINTLSKTMGGDTVAATNVLTTAMNQYGVSVADPIRASKVMAEMMNIMAAGAKEGSAELPQIKAAIEQTGMMAKTAGVGFAELNGAIQVLDKAGKKGAEGGVAIRNVLADLSQGEYMHKRQKDMLEQAGISAAALGDKSKTMSERLQLLKPIMNDNAKMALLFGKENLAAGIALVQGTSEIDRYMKVIQNTTTATDQAGIVMGSYQERMNRIKARFDDYKISIFNATKEYLPFIQRTGTVVNSMAQVASGAGAIKNMFGLLKKSEEEVSTTTTLFSGIMGGFKKVMDFVRNGMGEAALATDGFSVALYNIPVLGWIAAAIAAAVAAVYYLWENSRKFREVLFGVWDAAKAVFGNIATVVVRTWELAIKPVLQWIWNIGKLVFEGIWIVVKTTFGWIVDYYKWIWSVAVSVWTGIWDIVKTVAGFIWDVIKKVGAAIADFFGGIWEWIKSVFGGVASFINEWLIQPIKNAFNGLWDVITGVFNKIMEKMKLLFAPVVAIWNKIFSKNDMQDVGAAYEEGKKKGGESFDKAQEDKKKANEPQTAGQKALENKQLFSELMGGGGSGAAGKALGGRGGKDMSSNLTAGGKHPTTINLTIQKVIGIGEMKTTNFVGSAKEAGKQVVEEVLMALQSVSGKVSMQ